MAHIAGQYVDGEWSIQLATAGVLTAIKTKHPTIKDRIVDSIVKTGRPTIPYV